MLSSTGCQYDGTTWITPELPPCKGMHLSRGEPPLGAHRASQKWYLASWNVRTLLEVEGLIETAREFGDECG